MQPSCARFRCKEVYSHLYACHLVCLHPISLKMGSKWQKTDENGGYHKTQLLAMNVLRTNVTVITNKSSRFKNHKLVLNSMKLLCQAGIWMRCKLWVGQKKPWKIWRTLGFRISFHWFRHNHSSQNLVRTSQWNTFWRTFPPKNTLLYSTLSWSFPGPRSAVFHLQADLTKADYRAT